MVQIGQAALHSRDIPGDLQVYEGVGGAATTGAWFLPGSGNQTEGGLGIDGRDRGPGGGGDRSGGGGREGIAQDKAATAERLGISVREVRQIPCNVKRKEFFFPDGQVASFNTWSLLPLRSPVPAGCFVTFVRGYDVMPP